MALWHYTMAQLSQLAVAINGKWFANDGRDANIYIVSDTDAGILSSDLSQFRVDQKQTFMGVVGALYFFAFVGNVSTLYVNSRRKLRHFFRICLISLACSDLLSSSFLTLVYMAQFNAEYLQVWTLGPVMCKLVPFVTTATILASSLTLVAIALDRYMAIMRALLGFWNPKPTYCIICMSGIWLLSIGIAGPLIGIYVLEQVYVLELDEAADSENKLLVSEVETVNICISKNADIGLFYVILFTVIFMPCIVGFLWLNTIIAKLLWQRRHLHNQQNSSKQLRLVQLLQLEKPTSSNNTELPLPYTMLTACSVAVPAPITPTKISNSITTTSALPPSPAAAARAARHRRMVRVVLLMMAVFICLRLPTWVFLLMRLFGSFSNPIDWVLYFSFGILNLGSCALNPLFYTFLTETIRYLSLFKQQLWHVICCRRCREDQQLTADELPRERLHCSCCGLRQLSWQCNAAGNVQTIESIAKAGTDLAAVVEMDPQQQQQFYDFCKGTLTMSKENSQRSPTASIESSA